MAELSRRTVLKVGAVGLAAAVPLLPREKPPGKPKPKPKPTPISSPAGSWGATPWGESPWGG